VPRLSNDGADTAGHSPCGTMTIETSRVKCSGFKPCATSIVITYIIPSGIQKSCCENPGQPYHGTSRIAYLPDNEDGMKLLKRLQVYMDEKVCFYHWHLVDNEAAQLHHVGFHSSQDMSIRWHSWLSGPQFLCESQPRVGFTWCSKITCSFSWLVRNEPPKVP
jgi:hypothetical protein